MKNVSLFTGGLACLTLALALGQSAHANLVQNGSFQTGDFTDWTLSGTGGYTSVSIGVGPSGQNAWHEGAVGGDRFLTQNLATTSGDEYSISFWVDPVEGVVSDYQAIWGGTTVFDWHDGAGNVVTTVGTWTDSLGAFTVDQWQKITIDPMATSSSTALTLGIRQDPGYSNLTGVDVEDIGASTAPETAPTMLLLSLGLLPLLALRRRIAASC
jgi:hypothetical protein